MGKSSSAMGMAKIGALVLFLFLSIPSKAAAGDCYSYPSHNDVLHPYETRLMHIVDIEKSLADRTKIVFTLRDNYGNIWETSYVHIRRPYKVGDFVIAGWCPDLIILNKKVKRK